MLRVSLIGTRPEIWRRLRVAADLPLTAVHVALQIAMGWDAKHLYAFTAGADRFQANPLDQDDLDRVRLADLVKSGDRFGYVYDFGDNWQHDIAVEEVLETNEELYPVLCLDGEQAAPPEDCGGLPALARLVIEPGTWNATHFVCSEINDELFALFAANEYRAHDFVDQAGQPLPFHYDAEAPLDEEKWAELSSEERMWSVAAYHYWLREAGELPELELLSNHALMHTTVELHIASRTISEAAEALERLRATGVSRHDSLHAIISTLDAAMRATHDAAPEAYRQHYLAQLRLL